MDGKKRQVRSDASLQAPLSRAFDGFAVGLCGVVILKRNLALLPSCKKMSVPSNILVT